MTLPVGVQIKLSLVSLLFLDERRDAGWWMGVTNGREGSLLQGHCGAGVLLLESAWRHRNILVE